MDSSEPASNLRCLRVLRAELIANQLGYVGKRAEEVTALQQSGLPAGQVVVYIDQKRPGAADVFKQLDAAGQTATDTGRP